MADTTYTAGVKLVVETEGIDEGTQALVRNGKIVDETGKKYDALGKKIEETGKEVEDFPKPEKIKPPKPEVVDTFVSLRKRVKEAKEELQKATDEFGPFSQQAFEARKKAGELTAQLDDLNRQTKLIEPEDRIKAFQALGASVVGAFSIATGALQAFGAENEEVQKIAQKLQGALNIAQGVTSLVQLKEGFEDLRAILGITAAAQTTMNTATTAGAAAQGTLAGATVTTTGATNAASGALRGFAASLSATGIGAIVVAIGALAGAMIAFGRNTDLAAESNEDYTASLQRLKEKQTEATLSELRLQQSRAKSQDEKDRIELQIQQIENEAGIVKLKQKQTEQNKKLAEQGAEVLREGVGAAAGPFGQILTSALNLFRGTKQNLQDLKRDADLTAEEVLATEQINQNKITQLTEEQERKRKEQRTKSRVDGAKAAADAELKALQDGQAAIDAFQASQTGLRSQFESELQTQLADIQSKANLRKLRNEVTYFDKRKELAEVNLLEDIQAAEERITKLKEFGKTETDEYQQALLDRKKLNKQYNALITKNAKDAADKQADIDKDTTDKTKQQLAERRALAFEAAQESFDFLLQLNRQGFDQQTADLEQQREQGIITEEQYQEKLRAIKRKQARADKEAAIFQATLQFSSALINALTFTPATGVPIALKLAALTAGANLAKIIATPLPKFKRGTLSVPGLDGGQDSVMAMLRPGEAVIPTETNRAYAPAIAAIYRKQIKPSDINAFVMSRLSGKASLGRDASITASVDTFALGKALSRNKGVEVTNASLVGKAIASELTRTYNVRRA